MKNTLKWSLLSSLLSIVVHAYATTNYYALKLAMGTKSACNINALFNCDAITASSFSTVFGVPLSIWGGATNLALLSLLTIVYLGLSENRERLLRWAFYLSGFVLLMSLIMGSVSVFLLNTFCLSCVASYILSAITFELTRRSKEGELKTHFISDLKGINQNLGVVGAIFIGIPAISFFLHSSILNSHDAGGLSKIVKLEVSKWQASTIHEMNVTPALEYGKKDSKFIVSEFADFLCGHCKMASPSLDAFKKSHPEALFKFYTFPLDGSCNPVIPTKGNGVRCLLAKATICSGQQKVGWKMHNKIFENSEQLGRSSLENVTSLLNGWSKELGANADNFASCMDSEEVQKSIEAQSNLAKTIGVTGTPAIYVNGQVLKRGQVLPVLESAYNAVLP